ncbi:hypothetical protein FOZ62_013837 [Perkinsus olseni]|uniref:Uncharacterized protein n=1 Tax=Perkinsus olseni TaxID=32597 RepID=A0A7J6NFM0_PEROL|nr:hypothetical protein FOZ62_013837 [Perkinsus olseni]
MRLCRDVYSSLTDGFGIVRPGGLECLEESNSVLWGINWDDFMNQYLSLAALLRRHEDDGLPPPLGVPVSYRNRSLRIGIASTCDYKEGSVLHGIDRISLENRQAYSALHGYHVEFRTDNHIPSRHPVWSAVSLPLEMLGSGKFDWVLSIDCDCLFINMTVTLEHMLYRQGGLAGPQGPQLDPDVHFLISEDGRGLAGGSWMIRNSDWSRSFLRSVLGPLDEVHPYDKHDLKDQFALLWHVLRPLATTREVPEPTRTEFTDVRVAGWPELQYIPEVRLIPQRLINAYPWALCRPSHHCFQDDEDFIVSFITLSSQSREMAFAMLNKFRAQAMSNYELSAH